MVANPSGEVSRIFSQLGACVVQQCAKLRNEATTAVRYDAAAKAIRVRIPGGEEEFLLHPATVRRNDRSAQSIVSPPSKAPIF